ncbi:MAG: hypothetical protein V4591_08025 [Bdellovibrionota bacterium]
MNILKNIPKDKRADIRKAVKQFSKDINASRQLIHQELSVFGYTISADKQNTLLEAAKGNFNKSIKNIYEMKTEDLNNLTDILVTGSEQRGEWGKKTTFFLGASGQKTRFFSNTQEFLRSENLNKVNITGCSEMVKNVINRTGGQTKLNKPLKPFETKIFSDQEKTDFIDSRKKGGFILGTANKESTATVHLSPCQETLCAFTNFLTNTMEPYSMVGKNSVKAVVETLGSTELGRGSNLSTLSDVFEKFPSILIKSQEKQTTYELWNQACSMGLRIIIGEGESSNQPGATIECLLRARDGKTRILGTFDKDGNSVLKKDEFNHPVFKNPNLFDLATVLTTSENNESLKNAIKRYSAIAAGENSKKQHIKKDTELEEDISELVTFLVTEFNSNSLTSISTFESLTDHFPLVLKIDKASSSYEFITNDHKRKLCIDINNPHEASVQLMYEKGTTPQTYDLWGSWTVKPKEKGNTYLNYMSGAATTVAGALESGAEILGNVKENFVATAPQLLQSAKNGFWATYTSATKHLPSLPLQGC